MPPHFFTLDKEIQTMKFSIYIDVVHATKWGLNPTQATVYGWLSTVPFWADSILMDNDTWYFASRNKCLEEVPFVSDKQKADTVYRIYRQLIAKGLMMHQTIGKRDYIMFTDEGKKWGTKQSIPNSENNPGKFSTENNPTNNTYNRDPIISTNEYKDLPPEEIQIRQAIKKCHAYFAEWDSFRNTIIANQGIDRKAFDKHLEDWVRHKVDSPAIISNPTKHLHKTFENWIKRAKKFDGQFTRSNNSDQPGFYAGDASKMQ